MGENYKSIFEAIEENHKYGLDMCKTNPAIVFEVLRSRRQEVSDEEWDSFYNTLMINALTAMTTGTSTNDTYRRMNQVGAKEFAICTELAKDMTPEQAVWEKLGFQFSENSDDDVLCYAKLPVGWHLEQDKTSQYYKVLIDELGRVRGTMFYRYACNDRVARMELERRYQIRTEVRKTGTLETREIYFGNENEKLYVAGSYEYDLTWPIKKRMDAHKKDELLKEKAILFATTNYPDYESPTAYWNQEKSAGSIKK